MSKLPQGWSASDIGSVCEYIQRGKSPKYDLNNKKYPIINQKCIRWGYIDPEHLKFVTSDFWESIDDVRFLRKGDVLWNSTGTGTLGRAAVFSGLPDYSKAIVDSHVTILRPHIEVDPKYLYYWIQSPYIQNKIEGMQSGTTNQVELSKAVIQKAYIYLAPQNEQKRIVEKLDQVFAEIDSIKNRLNKIPTILSSFRQSVVRNATTGNLIGRNDSSNNWQVFSLDDVGELSRGKSKHRPRNDPQLFGGDYPFIQTGDIANAKEEVTHHTQTYNKFGLSQSKLFPAGTLCITIAANIADTAILTYPACFPDSIVGLTTDEKRVNVYFVKYFIDSLKTELESEAPATAQKNINLKTLKNIKLPLPSVEEQNKIVAKAKELLSLADRIEEQHELASKRINNMMQSLLERAFQGELVSQNPKDEPASVLLKEIKANKELQAQKPKSTRVVDDIKTKMPNKKPKRKSMIKKLQDVLSEQQEWLSAQEIFELCGIGNGSLTDEIETLYAELRYLDKLGKIEIETAYDSGGIKQFDRMKLKKAG